MKLRIKGNSVRFRLLKSEVERFAAAGVVSEELRFGIANDQVLRYSIAATDGVDELSAEFGDNQILLLVPESAAMRWTAGDEVAISNTVDIGDDETLELLIEKDFVCLDRPDDPDRDDAFPHP